MRRALTAVCAVLAVAGCDLSPALDIETPPFAPAVVMRAVLLAGEPPTVRLSVSGDPAAAVPATRLPTATPVGASVVLLRDGRVVETLVARSQTCYTAQSGRCNAETGRSESTQTGPFECGAFGGAMPVEAGATYTIRATVPGLPPAEATVVVPRPADVVATDVTVGPDEPREFRIQVRDAAPGPTRFGLSLFRGFGAFTTQVCRVGGARDTLVTLNAPWLYQGRFATSDPLLLADAGTPAASYPFAAFSDATFDGRTAALTVRSDPAQPSNVVPTRGYTVQVAVLSETLYQAVRTASVLFGEVDPFAEPADLPGNVVGGFGLVGAVAVTQVAVPER